MLEPSRSVGLVGRAPEFPFTGKEEASSKHSVAGLEENGEIDLLPLYTLIHVNGPYTILYIIYINLVSAVAAALLSLRANAVLTLSRLPSSSLLPLIFPLTNDLVQ